MDDTLGEFGLSSENLQLLEIFHPFALREMRRVREQNLHFAYYCKASTAMSILRNQEVWLRNITEMNDFAEIEYGVECLSSALKVHRDRMSAIFASVSATLVEDLVSIFNERLPQLKRATYICCVSKHYPHEDRLGRLSMWRAYGGNVGTALVFKSGLLLNAQQNFGAYSSPVCYPTHEEMCDRLAEILNNIEAYAPLLAKYTKEEITNIFLHIFEMAVLSTKHPGFAEEQEWRIFYRPTLDEIHKAEYSLETVAGVPQAVYKLKLADRPDEGVSGFTIKDNLKSIIIGPTDHSFVVRDALATCLRNLGIDDGNSMVVSSDIPLRVPF